MKRLASLAILFTFYLSACDNGSVHTDKHHNEEKKQESHASKQQHVGDEPVDHDAENHEADEKIEKLQDNRQTSSIRQTDSHLHGNAMLAIALDDDILVIELESPLYNLVGFEHAPNSELEAKHLNWAESVLSDPARLFVFNTDANCKPIKTEEGVSLIAEDEEHHEDEEHSEALIEYMFKCAMPEKLSYVSIELFKLFPKLTELETVYLGPSKQKQAVLKPDYKQFNFSK